MQTAVQLRKEKWASKESEPDRFVRMANHQERKESELDRLVRTATEQ